MTKECINLDRTTSLCELLNVNCPIILKRDQCFGYSLTNYIPESFRSWLNEDIYEIK